MARACGFELRTNGVVIAQVWRDRAGRQAALARMLEAADVRPLDGRLGRKAGELLGMALTGDAVDATVVAIAETGDRVVTSDPGDLSALAAAGRHVIVIPC